MKTYKQWGQESSESDYLLKRVQKIVTSIDAGAQVILYGSRARGSAAAASDWDLLILTDHQLKRKTILEIRDLIYDLELKTDTVLSNIFRTKKEWASAKYSVLPFRHAVEQEGVVL
jgi:predicted nucleotidyltransferase